MNYYLRAHCNLCNGLINVPVTEEQINRNSQYTLLCAVGTKHSIDAHNKAPVILNDPAIVTETTTNISH
jgi:hypothetical protein